MQIIAKTKEGFLISATENEISTILSSISRPVTDKNPLVIGDKIPAFDYVATIQKCRLFKDSYDFRKFKEYTTTLATESAKIVSAFESLVFEKED